MGRGSSTRWSGLVIAGGLALIVLMGAIMVITRSSAEDGLAPLASAPTVAADPPAVTVNGQPIGVNAWAEAVRLDQTMSRFAGVAAMDARQTLERLINEELVLRAAPQDEPGAAQVEGQIAALEAAWQTSDEQIVAALTAAGLSREALVRAVERVLMVQQAQAELTANGTDFGNWLARERENAEIVYDEERIAVVLSSLGATNQPAASPVPAATEAASLPPTAVAPTSTPPPTRVVSELDTAPDFTLPRSDGGDLTLSEQLASGPVVLVFFHRSCSH